MLDEQSERGPMRLAEMICGIEAEIRAGHTRPMMPDGISIPLAPLTPAEAGEGGSPASFVHEIGAEVRRKLLGSGD